MRIATVVPDLSEGGGVQKSAYNFIREFETRGHTNDVITETTDSTYANYLKNIGVSIYSGTELTKIIQKDPDIIHVHGHNIGVDIIKKLYKRTSAKIIEHNIWDRATAYQKYVDVTCLMSHFGQWRFQTTSSMDRSIKKIVVPNPIDTETFYSENQSNINLFKEKHNIPTEAVILGRVGQAYLGKWSPLTLASFYSLAKKLEDLYLVLRGVPCEMKDLINKFPQNIIDRIIILPFLSDDELRRLYSTIDIFIHTAKQGETFGNVLVESMLCETPVVTLSTPYKDNAQVEVVKHDVGGLVASSYRDFVEAIFQLYSMPSQRERYGEEGRKRAERKYSQDHVVNRVLKAGRSNVDSGSISTSRIMDLLNNTQDGLNKYQKYLIKSKPMYEKLAGSILPTEKNGWELLMEQCTDCGIHTDSFESIQSIGELAIDVELPDNI